MSLQVAGGFLSCISRKLDVNPFCVVFWKCFLPTCGFFFTVFIVSFDVQNFIFSLFPSFLVVL